MTEISDQLHDYFDALSLRLLEDTDPSRLRPTTMVRTPERRRRKSHYRAYAAAALVLALVAVALSYGQGQPGHRVVTTESRLFIPTVRSGGATTYLPIVFPDGSSVELAYPRTARLASLGLIPWATVDDRQGQPSENGSPCCDRMLLIEHGTIAQVMGGRRPTQYYTGGHGQRVPFFDSSKIGGGPLISDNPYLAFQFGDWVVLAWDYPAGDRRGVRMTDQQRAVFAADLDGHENQEGFLVLQPKRPLCLVPSEDGPDLALGPGNSGVWLYLKPVNHGVEESSIGLSAHGYRMVTWGADLSLLTSTGPFELALPKNLQSIKDDIQIIHVHQVTRWRC